MLSKLISSLRTRSPDSAREDISEASGSHAPAATPMTENTIEASSRRSNEQGRTSIDSNASSPANSFTSIDTISDAGSDREIDTETEKNWRMRKLLKYSRWKNRLSAGGDEANSSVLDKLMAKQERKLQELEERRVENSVQGEGESSADPSKLQPIEEDKEVSLLPTREMVKN